MTTPDSGETWGILGGTFDPVHNGHITLAQDCLIKKNLDGILCIPSFLHPFKKNDISASFDDRIEMLKFAVAGMHKFTISTIEKDNSLSGYTIDTIRAVKKRFPSSTFYFIIGADNLSQIDKWHKPDEIIQEIRILAGNRPNFELKVEDKYRDAVEFIESSYIDIASTEIKQMIQDSKIDSLSDVMHPDVISYIKQRELYL